MGIDAQTTLTTSFSVARSCSRWGTRG